MVSTGLECGAWQLFYADTRTPLKVGGRERLLALVEKRFHHQIQPWIGAWRLPPPGYGSAA